ncbi:uncharacterized protein LOC123678645 [Harmonia axyridis]|uniref:uncharacterized protein LOC123678645 n=1 Tax=Harmonia axyridis TaxID=115357 RepID=UPI001E27838A|nr:uncharacterized protein LOC123678645 [Harmonia axyridis]
MATVSCMKCSLAIKDGTDNMLRCDGCNRPIHASCSELTAAELKCFNLRSNVKRRVKYLCLECEQGLHQIPKILQLISEMRDEIRELKRSESVDVGVTQVTSGPSPQSSEEIINEVFERTKRSHNLIIHGSIERGANRQDQLQIDSDMVQSILNECVVSEQNFKFFRIGKFDSTKEARSRPIKVSFSSPDPVSVILRRFKKLKSKFEKIYVAPDRTPQQVAFYRSVRSELDQRLAAGESNLRIKSACEYTYDIVCITETWLGDSVFDGELFPPGYKVIRCDRQFGRVNRSRGGGVLVAASNSTSFSLIDGAFLTDRVPLVDVVLCRFTEPFTFIVCVVYIPPDITVFQLETFTTALELNFSGETVFLVGDFNCPDFVCSSRGPKSILLQNFCDLLGLRQFNSVLSGDLRLLDLVLASNNFEVSVIHCDSPFVPEDLYHPALSMVLSLESPKRRRADYSSLSTAINSVNWDIIAEFKSVDEALDFFYGKLFEILDDLVPRRTNYSADPDFPVWFTRKLKRDIRLKNYYRRLRALVKSEINLEYSRYLSEVQSQIRSNPSSFWKYLDQRRGSTRIPGVFHSNERLYDDPREIVDLFGAHFSNVNNLTAASVQDSEYSTNFPPVFVPSVTDDEIKSIMEKYPDRLTSGDDQLPAVFLRECSSALAGPLHRIISISLSSFTFPMRWKRARVVPVFKKGDSSSVENYRPISILSNFAKVYEEVLYSSIYHHIKQRLSSAQHGFVRGRSTVTNLATISQVIAESLDDGGQVDVIYTDFSRAFDTVDHNLLLNKLASLGFAPDFVRLLRSYLKGRTNYVFYNGFRSFEYELKFGVPQGSNLGPLLFIIFIDDLLCSLNCEALAYADDLKLFMRIHGINDQLLLQSSLELVQSWCLRNGLILNLKKCFKVTFTRKTQPLAFDYHIGGDLIAAGDHFRDLGVWFDSELSFVPHVEDLCSSACRSLGFLFRSFRELDDLSALRNVYFSLVLSRLEYANMIWFPIYATHLTPIERVQRKFLKYVVYRKTGIYPERGVDLSGIMEELKLSTLFERQVQQCARFAQKLLGGRIDCPFLLSRVNIHVPRMAARSSPTFGLPTPRTNILQRAPVYRLCDCANKVNISLL